MLFAEKLARAVMASSRARKHNLFLDVMRPSPGDTLLDVGADFPETTPYDNYLEKHYTHPNRITAVTIQDADEFSRLYPAVTVIRADGRSLPFTNEQFDIGFSNAVIEHVGGERDQVQFMRELVRVCKRGYITTPNKLFPIETHTRVLLLHLLPKPLFERFLILIGKRWATGNYMNLLTKQKLRDIARRAGLEQYWIKDTRLGGLSLTIILYWDKYATQN